MDPFSTALVVGAGTQLLGGMFGADESRSNARKDRALQEAFARQGIQWRVEDAKKAGIHPLAALNAQIPQYQPVNQGTPIGDAFSNMGQNFSAAASRSLSKEDKMYNQAMQVEQVRNAQLKNKLLEHQITSISNSNNPGLPSNSGLGSLTKSGQGDAYVLEQPLVRTHSPIGKPHQEVGHSPDVGFAKTPTGLAPVPSKDIKERIEDQMIPEISWAIRNQLMPNFGYGDKPSRGLLPKGYDWQWSVRGQEWRPVPHSSKTPWQRWKNYITDWQQ